jgi:hypothetical protein
LQQPGPAVAAALEACAADTLVAADGAPAEVGREPDGMQRSL